MGFSRYRKEYVDLETINEHLKYCEKYRECVYRKKNKDETFANKAFIEDNRVYFQLTYKKGTKACTYIFRKDGTEEEESIDGGESFRILNLYYKVPRFADEQILALSTSPLSYINEEYNWTRNDAIGYDLNSAYSWAMLQPMPDTSVPYRTGYVQEGEVGFMEMPTNDGRMSLVPRFKGFSLWIFPLMESPFKKFVEHWYSKKLNPETKSKAKGVLNYCVGYLKRVNPFLRAMIVGNCNIYIDSLIDEYTLYCNTDSIVSLRERPDFIIGTNVGEWKVERIGKFAFRDHVYQWDMDKPSYKGVSKSWFKEGWDVLKDKSPVNGNIYEYKNYRIVERKI